MNKVYAIHYAYPSSDKAKELGYEKEGRAYLCLVEQSESAFFNLDGKVVKSAETVEELVQYCKDKKKPLCEYSLGTERFGFNTPE